MRTDRVEETPSDQEGGQGSVLTRLLSGGVAQGEGRAPWSGDSSWHSDSVSQESSSWYL